jgi:hypothetical protein
MSNTEHINSRVVPSIDLEAALKHDAHIATREGFTRVAQRAFENLKWLQQATAEMHAHVVENGGYIEVSIVVKAVER